MFEKVIEMFNNAGFTGEYYSGEDGCYIMNIGGLRVGVFSHCWPNDYQKQHVIAEHEDNFDKWSKSFYWCDLPENQDQFDALLRDLEHIDNEEDRRIGNDFGLLKRTF